MKWRTGVCPYCETEYGTYSEDENDYGEHECTDIRINALEEEIERLQKAVAEADNLLYASRDFVQDMVGIASGARGLPEEIDIWLEEYGKGKK